MLIDRNVVQAALEALEALEQSSVNYHAYRSAWEASDDLRAALAAEPTRSQKLTDAGFKPRPSLWAMQARQALELIAAPMRSDGTFNRDRETCRQLAAEALGRYDDDEIAPPAQPEPLTASAEKPNAVFVPGYGYVDVLAVRAVERAHGIGEKP